jgi:hypothetical protein
MCDCGKGKSRVPNESDNKTPIQSTQYKKPSLTNKKIKKEPAPLEPKTISILSSILARFSK